MPHDPTTPCTAFAGPRIVAQGPLAEVALALHATSHDAPVLTFDDTTGKVIDLDLRGTPAQVTARFAPPAEPQATPPASRPRGRPKLGVVAREVTLLPRHWDWLAEQQGGASATLRRLVEQARREDGGRTDARRARTAAYTFLSAIAGDLPRFEEATRALFAGDTARLTEQMQDWPGDIAAHALRLAADK